MATHLAASSMEKSRTGLLRLSLNLMRNMSTSSAATSNPPVSSVAKRKKKKQKNLFEVAQFLPNWGVGYHLAKTHWSGVSYQITKLNLYKDGKHGKAWGIVHKDGLPPADAPKKISGVHKRCWRYIPNLPKIEGTQPETQAA
ncbi:putative mitochondrial 28S ribosomal protein S34 [Heracleum sosnowskyi]|uniref:Mitochondrial 28S ribosomal protein S34 n=1 Tax=Heracleum sosnowskyi TaxID=360622 RepID=A0AAD8IV54_9APIA|nr:putative mitochondrial 28S ribosomal protein S34 [Heracleum sosnowskyi]